MRKLILLAALLVSQSSTPAFAESATATTPSAPVLSQPVWSNGTPITTGDMKNYADGQGVWSFTDATGTHVFEMVPQKKHPKLTKAWRRFRVYVVPAMGFVASVFSILIQL